MTSPNRGSDISTIIREIREARFTHGLVCPHCAGTRCHRWGSFSGRQRYRCAACRRTFSDLTATPAWYLKRLAEFARYRGCMRACASVRRGAVQVGVHKDTAFRWRHRVLDEVRARDGKRLHGFVEVIDMPFPDIDKGHSGRRTSSVPRRRSRYDRVWVTFVADRCGTVATTITGRRRPGTGPLYEAFTARIAADATLLTSDRRLGAHVRMAQWLALPALIGLRHQPTENLAHTHRAWRYGRMFRRWLEPFRGVSTCYLDNYLAWFARVVRAERVHAFHDLFQWQIRPTEPQPPPTIPADSG